TGGHAKPIVADEVPVVREREPCDGNAGQEQRQEVVDVRRPGDRENVGKLGDEPRYHQEVARVRLENRVVAAELVLEEDRSVFGPELRVDERFGAPEGKKRHHEEDEEREPSGAGAGEPFRRVAPEYRRER